MNQFIFLSWPNWLVVSLCFVLAFVPSFLLVYFAGFSKHAPKFDRFDGVAPPMIGAVSLLFGLFAAFLANDVWSKYQLAVSSVAHEAESVRNIARLYEGTNREGAEKMNGLLKNYLVAVIESDWPAMKEGHRSKEILPRVREISHEIIGGETAKNFTSAVQSKALDSFSQMREYRQTRVSIAEGRRFSAKWYGMVLFGLLTQIMIVFIHLKKPWPMFLSQTIFSISFAACISILVLHDFPFSELNSISTDPLTKALDSLSR